MHRFRVEAPADTLGALLPVLAALRAVPQTTETRGCRCVLEGAVPAGRVHALEQRLPGLTRGEGELETAFDHYAPVTYGTVPRTSPHRPQPPQPQGVPVERDASSGELRSSDERTCPRNVKLTQQSEVLTLSGNHRTVVDMPNIRARLLVVLVVLFGFLTVAGVPPATAATLPDSLWFDDTAAHRAERPLRRRPRPRGRAARLQRLRRDQAGGEQRPAVRLGRRREEVRDRAARPRRRQLGPLPAVLGPRRTRPRPVDTTYLAAATAQMRAFLDAGIRVYPDFHQDLYSRHLFNSGSWYTGDGAPEWAVDLGGYPQESCGVCLFWGQNITQNAGRDQGAVRLLAQHLRPAGLLPRHRAEDHGVRRTAPQRPRSSPASSASTRTTSPMRAATTRARPAAPGNRTCCGPST